MRIRIATTVILLALAALVSVAVANPSSAPITDAKPQVKHPASCDGKPVVFHRRRARVLIKKAYANSRYPDKSPAKSSEKRAWQKHKRCIRIEKVRAQIGRYRKNQADQYNTYWRRRYDSDPANWCSPSPHPAGGGCWVIPESCVMAESGGSWTAHNPTSPARGPYQLLGHGEPWPVTTRSEAMEHHRIAARLYAQSGLGPWVAPAC